MKMANAKGRGGYCLPVILTLGWALMMMTVLTFPSSAQWVLHDEDGNIDHCAAISDGICTTCDGERIKIGHGTVSKSSMCKSPNPSPTPPSSKPKTKRS